MFARNRFAPQAHALRLPVVLVRNVLYPGDVRRKLARLQEAGHQRDRETLRSVDARALRRQLPRFHAKSLAIPDVADLHTQLPNFTAPPRATARNLGQVMRAGHDRRSLRDQ